MMILSLPIYLVFILIFVFSIVVAIAGCYLITKFQLNDLFLTNNEFISIAYPVVGLVYGVLLAFTIVIVWGQYLDAEKSVTHEATHLSQLWRDGQVFPECERDILQDRLQNYISMLIDEMQGKENKKPGESQFLASRKLYEEIWQFYYGYQPGTEQEKIFYAQSLTQLNEAGQQRRLRLMYSEAEIHPTLWVFLVGGGVITIAFVFLVGTGNGRIKILVTTLLSVLIISSIYLVFTFQHPFEGTVSIRPDPYIMLKESFEHRKEEKIKTSPCKT